MRSSHPAVSFSCPIPDTDRAVPGDFDLVFVAPNPPQDGTTLNPTGHGARRPVGPYALGGPSQTEPHGGVDLSTHL